MLSDNSIIREKLLKKNRVTSKVALFLLVLLFLFVLLGSRVFILVKSGELGIIWSFFSGVKKDVILSEGINLVSPLNEVFIYDIRFKSVDKTYTFQTNEGLDITLQVNIRTRPDIRALPELHQSVGENYFEIIVVPQIEAVVRRVVGKYSIEEIYRSSKGFNENLTVASIEAIESRYVLIDRVLIKSISIPDSVKKAIESKLALEQESQSYRFKLEIAAKEAQRQIIEAQGVNDSQKIIGQSLSNELLRWHGIVATKDLSKSPNAKTVIYGAGRDGLPLIMNDKQ